MAIEKMVLLKIMGSLDNMNPILRELIFCENLNLNVEDDNNAYNDYLALNQYESEIIGLSMNNKIDSDNIQNDVINPSPNHVYDKIDPDFIHESCSNCMNVVEELCQGLGLELKIDNKFLMEKNYTLEQAKADLYLLQSLVGGKAEEVNLKKQQIKDLYDLREKIDGLFDKDVDFRKIADLNYFDYELGTFSVENKSKFKKNYQTLSAIILKIGSIKNSSEDLYMIIYPKQYKEEIGTMLKLLNWNQVSIPKESIASPVENLIQIHSKIDSLQKEIDDLNSLIEDVKEKSKEDLLKIYNILKLEDKIAELEQKAVFSNNAFGLNVWVRDTDKEIIEKAISNVTDKYRIITNETDDFEDSFMLL